MDFITADKRLIEASLARVDQFTKDRHIGIIHSTATRQNTLLYWLLKPVIALTGSSAFAFASAVDPLTQTRAVAELLSNLGDGWDQAAALACDVISIPSANFTPRISLGRRL
jgi:diphthamide synthase subunit DPH2